jgi:serine/threonine-protein kinase
MPTDPPASRRPTGPAVTSGNLDQTLAYRGGGETPADEVARPTVAAGAVDGGATKVPAGPAPATAVAGQHAPATAHKTSSTLGPYKLLKKLGQGGMGTVYKAQKVGTHEIVAVKVLAKEMAARPGFIQRFQREARVMTQLDHPNILRAHDVGTAGGFHYLAMEFVDGGSVETHLRRLGKFSPGDAVHIVLACARALHHAHEQGMVHRDVKPDNILLTADGTIKVADLGLAKQLDEDMDLTKTGAGAGTPMYMAPEQARDVKHVDRRCDIYSLGCMLYVFLTGHTPFGGATLVEVISAKEKGKFQPIRRSNDAVPERLDLIVDKMLAARPEHRFATCAELIDALEPLGLAHDRLSFIADPAEPAPARPAPTIAPRPAKMTQHVPEPVVPPPAQAADDWFLKLPGTAQTVKRLTAEQIRTMLRSGSLHAEALVSRDPKAGFRALGTYNEFQGLLRGLQSKEKVEKKGARTKDLFRELEEADARRRKWKWLRNLVGGAGNTLVGLLWIGLLLALLAIGAYFFYIKVMK